MGEDMNKAMMYLVQKSASRAVDRARGVPPRTSHFVSIELLEDQTEKAVGEPEKMSEVEGADDLVPRKRTREDA